MRRTRLAQGVRCLLLMLAPAGAWAGIENTHHDMRLYSQFEEGGVCAYCHVPHAALGTEGLFARTSAVSGLGPIGAFCYSCHDGTVIPTALVEAPDGTLGIEALLGSHGYEIARIESATRGLETATSVLSSGLVKVPDPLSPPQRLDCNACHDPHQDQYAPFLKLPLGELCQKCHAGKDGLGKGRWTRAEDVGALNGPHPIGMPLKDGGTDRVRPWLPVEMTFHEPDPPFNAPTPTPAELRSTSVHWETGGHFVGAERAVSCATCHSAHLPKDNQLVGLASSSPERGLCGGCHGATMSAENPGATPYFHPVFESSYPPYEHDHAAHGEVPNNPDVPTVGVIELFVTLPQGWPVGPEGELLCRTCHQAHQGVPGKRCVRRASVDEPVVCNGCHAEGPFVWADVNRHHPVGKHDYTTPEYGGFPTSIAWSAGSGLAGDLADGLQCVDCHTGLAKSAHNW